MKSHNTETQHRISTFNGTWFDKQVGSQRLSPCIDKLWDLSLVQSSPRKTLFTKAASLKWACSVMWKSSTRRSTDLGTVRGNQHHQYSACLSAQQIWRAPHTLTLITSASTWVVVPHCPFNGHYSGLCGLWTFIWLYSLSCSDVFVYRPCACLSSLKLFNTT